jgi:hypothetical protein
MTLMETRMAEDRTPHGWRWQHLCDALACVTEQDVVQTSWPRGGNAVSVPVATTSVRTLSRCPVVIVHHLLSAPRSQARSWTERDLEAGTAPLLAHRSARWDRAVLTASGKEARGLDHSQAMSAQHRSRFWTLAILVSVTLRARTLIACNAGGNAP